MQLYCGHCGNDLTGAGAFCGECGQAVTSPSPLPPVAPPQVGYDARQYTQPPPPTQTYSYSPPPQQTVAYPAPPPQQYPPPQAPMPYYQPQPQPYNAVQGAAAQYSDMGRLLVMGSGKDLVISGAASWILYIILAGASVGLGFLLAELIDPIPVRQGLFHTYALDLSDVFIVLGIIIGVCVIVFGLIQDIFSAKTFIYVYENGVKGAGGGPKFLQSVQDTMSVSSFQFGFDRIASVDITTKAFLTINAYGRIYTVALTNGDEVMRVINERIYQTRRY